VQVNVFPAREYVVRVGACPASSARKQQLEYTHQHQKTQPGTSMAQSLKSACRMLHVWLTLLHLLAASWCAQGLREPVTVRACSGGMGRLGKCHRHTRVPAVATAACGDSEGLGACSCSRLQGSVGAGEYAAWLALYVCANRQRVVR
jgi:hypothetical protein